VRISTELLLFIIGLTICLIHYTIPAALVKIFPFPARWEKAAAAAHVFRYFMGNPLKIGASVGNFGAKSRRKGAKVQYKT